MFDGLINIKTLEGSALSGNAAPPCIYQGASHQGKLGPSRYVVLTVHFVRMLSQLWKSLRGFILLHRGLALQEKKKFLKKPVVLLTAHPSQPGERNNVKDRCLLVRPAPAHALQRYVFVGYLCYKLLSTYMEGKKDKTEDTNKGISNG